MDKNKIIVEIYKEVAILNNMIADTIFRSQAFTKYKEVSMNKHFKRIKQLLKQYCGV